MSLELLSVTRIYGNIHVKPGDKVVLIPFILRWPGEIEETYFDFLRGWLGDGPFTISSIGQWPCGKVMLYLKGTKSGEPGAFASHFMVAPE